MRFHTPMNPASRRAGARCGNVSGRPWSAFTLLEVLLAIVIATGLLVTALHFHLQTVRLRGELLRESDRIALARLIMDRMTSELRCAWADRDHRFVGESQYLQFHATELPSVRAWTSPSGGFGGLKQVSYGLSQRMEGTNAMARGVVRIEQISPAGGVLDTNVPVPMDSGPSNLVTRLPAPLSELIRHVRFRYSDGSQWNDTWEGDMLPRGVEVTLGVEAAADEDAAEEPGEVFRRVIFLPASRPRLESHSGTPQIGRDP